MQYIALDSFELHNIPTPGKFQTSQPIQGLEIPLLRTTSFPHSGQDGTIVAQQFFGDRRILLNGFTNNITSFADHTTQRQAFLANCSPVKDSSGNLLARTLKFTTDDGQQFRIGVQVVAPSMPQSYLLYSKWKLDLLATEDTISSETLTSITMSQYVGGGFILPVILPIVFGTGSGGTYTASNLGDSNAYPTITLNGPLTNPYLQNQTTGEYISLTLSIALGETVVIDMRNRTIIQGGATNRISTKTAGSTFWVLTAGNNILRLTTSVSGEGGTAIVAFRSAYRGV